MIRSAPLRLTAVAALAALLAAGCANKVTLRYHPPGYDPAVRSVAVAPFENNSLQGGAGGFVASRVAAALRQNGTYTVVGPRDVARLYGPDSAYPDSWTSSETLLDAMRRDGDGAAHALLVGEVALLGADQQTYVEYDGPYFDGFPHSAFHYGGHYGYPHHYHRGYSYAWYMPTYRTVTLAAAEGSATLLRVSNGETIGTTPDRAVQKRRTGRGLTGAELLSAAVDELARQVVEAFAITDREVEIDPNRALRIGVRDAGGELRTTSTFESGGEAVVAEIRLPEEAAQNEFALVVGRKGAMSPLAEKRFTWTRDLETKQVIFEPEEFAQGTGEYELTLLVNEQKVITRQFRLE